mmetsp:Transcript_13379/g.28832  ORF Transcript_13379/g.28832 Transcript_13379/m.28832 type:complete len:124 (-) Transcript_13379:1359-1730(-)
MPGIIEILAFVVTCGCIVITRKHDRHTGHHRGTLTGESDGHPSQPSGVALGPVPASGGAQEAADYNVNCVVCQSNKRNTLFLPCKHFACCRNCADRVFDGSGRRRCPVCKQPIDQVIHGVFTP